MTVGQKMVNNNFRPGSMFTYIHGAGLSKPITEHIEYHLKNTHKKKKVTVI